MRTLISLIVVLFNINNVAASLNKSDCSPILGKWKCIENNPYGPDKLIFFNIILLSDTVFRINLNHAKIPEPDSYFGFNIYLDGRIDENIRGRAICNDSFVVIDYLEDLEDITSSYQRSKYEITNNTLQISEIYYSSGAVIFSQCSKL